MDAKFAFTAQYWGDGAVISRAIEDRPGPIVEQQFGEFSTWTQAHNFASKLNDGLELGSYEVRQIVTSSFLATACVMQEALNSQHSWIGFRAERYAREAHLRFVFSELEFAMTLCRSVAPMSEAASLCTFAYAQKALHHARRLLLSFGGDYGDLEGVVQRAEELQMTLQSPPLHRDTSRGLLRQPSMDSGWLGHSELALSYSNSSPARPEQSVHSATSDGPSGSL